MWTEWGCRNQQILATQPLPCDDEIVSNIEELWQRIHKLKSRIKALENIMPTEKRKILKADKCLKKGCHNLELKCRDCGRIINESSFPRKMTAKKNVSI